MLRIQPEFPPSQRLTRLRPRITAILKQPSIDKHPKVSPVPPDMGIENVVFRNTSSQNQSTRLFGSHGDLVDFSDVLDDVEDEVVFVGVGEEHIADSAVGYGWAEYGDVVFVAPVVDALGVVDLFAEPSDHLARSPDDFLFDLLLIHLCKNRQQEFLQPHIVFCRDQYIPYPTVEVLPVIGIIHVEIPQEEVIQALHNILLNPSPTGNNTVNHLMLSQVPHNIPHPTRRHIRSVPQKYRTSHVFSEHRIPCLLIIVFSHGLIAQPPMDGLVEDVDAVGEVGGLEARGGE